MFRKIIITSISIILLAFNVNAASDGELVLKKNEPSEVRSIYPEQIEMQTS